MQRNFGEVGDICTNNDQCQSNNCVYTQRKTDTPVNKVIGICNSSGTSKDGFPNNTICGSDNQCVSGNCFQSVCQPPSGKKYNTNTSSNIGWWVWASMVIGIIIVILLIIVIYRELNRDDNVVLISEY